MKCSEIIVIPVVMVGCFAGGYFCGYGDNRRGGGVVLSNPKPLQKGPAEYVQLLKDDSATCVSRERFPNLAAAYDIAGPNPSIVAAVGSASGLRVETKGNSLVARNGYEDGKTISNSVYLKPSPNCREPGGESGLCQALTLLWKAESSNGRFMEGDGGYARGHLQFHEGTWNDGLSLLGLRDDLSWQWPQATNDLWRCFVVEIAHWQRYCPQALKDGNLELLVRTHRLPSAPYRDDNQSYADRVLKGE